MGEIERRAKKRARRRNIQAIALQTAAAAGVIAVAAFAPKVLTAFHTFGWLPTRYDTTNIARARKALLKSGMLSVEGNHLRLTKKGEAHLRVNEARMRLSTRKKWDGRWRVLIFDIPERRKSIRERVRRLLADIGFHRLQDSVWAYPHDFEDLIVLLKADLKIGKDMLYMVVDEMEYDIPLRRHFGLHSRI